MKGTQLKQLSDEYQSCTENLQRVSQFLESKREVLPELRKAAKDAVARYDGAKKAVEQKEKLQGLRQELAWSHVKDKETVTVVLSRAIDMRR